MLVAILSCVFMQLNPVLVGMSYYGAWRAGVLPFVSFRMKDFWSVNLKDFDVVSMFGVTPAMTRLEEKLLTEAKPGLRVVCFRFPIKGREPIWQEKELYIYKV
jgi:hypothetical protein